jgi:hypothetical protein
MLRTLPEASLLTAYAARGAYTDCYTLDLAGAVSHEAFVTAFYTSRLFKVERLILAVLLGKPSTDAQMAQVATGKLDRFAAWSVEARATDQILACDYQGRTRSWLMVAPAGVGVTRLFFGTVVVPDTDRKTGEKVMPPAFRWLLGFHRVYAQALLRSAVARLGAVSLPSD